MKESGGYEIKNRTRGMFSLTVAVGSVILFILDLYYGWEVWTVPLFLGAALSGLVLLFYGNLEEKTRFYIYSVILCVELLYYFLHSGNPYAGMPALFLVLAVVAVTQELVLVRNVVLTGVLAVVLRFAIDVHNSGQKSQTRDVVLFICYLALVLLTGVVAWRVVIIYKEIQAFSDKKNRELEQEIRNENEFLEEISSRLKVPVNRIIELAGASIREEKDEEIQSRLSEILKEAGNVAGHLDNVYDHTEIRMKKLRIRKEDYRLSSVIDELARELLPYKSKETELVIDVDPELPRVLRSDSRMIHSILRHVVSNALSSTEQGGVYVRIYATGETYGINLNIDVRDTGEGMSHEKLEGILEGRTGSGELTEKWKNGLGLGLQIVAGYVRELEGFFTIESEPDEGTRFHICIPQEVTDPFRCMSVDMPDSLIIAGYLQFEKYQDPNVREFYHLMMNHMLAGLGLTMHRAGSMEELREYNRRYGLTHVFVGEEQYEEDTDYLEELSHTLKLVVICSKGYRVREGSGAILLTKPFYCFPVISILNGDQILQQDEAELPFSSDAPGQEKERVPEEKTPGKPAGETGSKDALTEGLKKAGVDTAKGMEWCLNDRELYEGILLEFAGDAAEKRREMQTYFEKNELEEFTIRVHSIKSSSRMIGAEELARKAEELEKAARNGEEETVKLKYPEFLPAYEAVVAEIRSALEARGTKV